MKPEERVVLRICNYLRKQYPEVPFRVDQIDQVGRVHGKKNSQLHGRWAKGYPDIFIMMPKRKKHGLFLEVKAGKVPVNDHTRRQAAYHQVLKGLGYQAKFGEGYEDSIAIIERYMR